MRQIIEELAKKCKESIEDAAYYSYSDGSNPYRFDGCWSKVKLDGDDVIEIVCDKRGCHDVAISKKHLEYPNVEQVLAEYLDANADECGAWQDSYDNDMWRTVAPGCDPAFPRHGDFERWVFGY